MRQLTAAAVLAAALAGSIGYWTGAAYEPVELVETSLPVELKTADAAVLAAELTNAGVSGATCAYEQLVIKGQLAEVCYCRNGSAGWESLAEQCKAEVSVSDGKVFVKE